MRFLLTPVGVIAQSVEHLNVSTAFLTCAESQIQSALRALTKKAYILAQCDTKVTRRMWRILWIKLHKMSEEPSPLGKCSSLSLILTGVPSNGRV